MQEVKEEEKYENILLPPLPPELEIKTHKYENLIPISKADYEALWSWIAEDRKLIYPIIINQHGDVLDGHNRLKICRELGIQPWFRVIRFDNDLEEEKFVRLINVKRRHMIDFQKAEQGVALEPIESELARQRQLSGRPLGTNDHKGKTRDLIAMMVGLSSGKKYERAKALIKHGSEELKQNLRDGKTTLPKAYSLYIADKKRIEVRAQVAAEAKGLSLLLLSSDKVKLLNKDSTKLEELTEIPDGSADLILTDPPYSADSLYLYEALARLASQKLKQGGSVVFYFGKNLLFEIGKIFSKYSDLTYCDWFVVRHQGHGARMHDSGVVAECKLMLWFVKGEKKNRLTADRDIHDFIDSSIPDKSQHPWAQSRIESDYLIEKLTVSEDSLVVDPFLGSGAFAIPAIKRGRYFIGIDINEETLENARYYIISQTFQLSLSDPKIPRDKMM